MKRMVMVVAAALLMTATAWADDVEQDYKNRITQYSKDIEVTALMYTSTAVIHKTSEWSDGADSALLGVKLMNEQHQTGRIGSRARDAAMSEKKKENEKKASKREDDLKEKQKEFDQLGKDIEALQYDMGKYYHGKTPAHLRKAIVALRKQYGDKIIEVDAALRSGKLTTMNFPKQ